MRWHRDITGPNPTGLIVIARAASGQILTRITFHRDLRSRHAHGPLGAHRSALDAVRVEVHHVENSTLDYPGMPPAAISRDSSRTSCFSSRVG